VLARENLHDIYFARIFLLRNDSSYIVKKNSKLKKRRKKQMLKGIFLIGWDNALGSTIEAKYPQDCQIQTHRITQYLATLQSFGKSSNIQIKEENELVLIFGSPGTANYGFILVILEDLEDAEIPKIQSRLTLEGENILKTPYMERKKVFLEFARNLIKQKQKKVVFMGYPNSGKTTTKQFFFEQIQSEKLMETTSTPTKGVESNFYSLIDSDIVMFDTSGQEIERWYNIDETPLIGSDLTIFFITVMDWKQNPTRVKSDLSRLLQLSEKYEEIRHDVVLFCHKFDEITENVEEFKQSLIHVTQTLGITVFFTSIKNAGNFDLHLGYQLMLRNFSPLFTFINDFLSPIISKYQQSGHLLYLLDSNFDLISDFTDFTKSYENVERANIQQKKDTITKMMKRINIEGNISVDFMTFSDETNEKIVIWLKISKFHPDFSFVIMQAESYLVVDEIYQEYIRQKDRFSWIMHVN
jgi:signal recognition particle receptor subunit beta